MQLKPISIGDKIIDPPLMLAPMAGQTNHAFRTLCREIGDCGLVCTELLSSHAIHYKSEKTFNMFDWAGDQHPFAVQLYGSDPTMMAEAARVVVDHGADIVDINMGCWVPKVAKTGAGAALLKDVCTATAVVDAIIKAVNVPVTVKIRSGFTADNLTAVPFAKAAEASGVKSIVVHARTAEQGFSGEANWDMIRQVKESVSNIPVIGNGDVKTADDAAQMLRETGCDGVMIGRAALGNPWIFHQIAHELRTGETLPPPTPQERAAIAFRHAQITMSTTLMPERQAVLELRGQLSQYHIGVRGAAQLRSKLVQVQSLAEIETLLLPIIEADEPMPTFAS